MSRYVPRHHVSSSTVVYAIRYGMGRMTYADQDARDLVRVHWADMHPIDHYLTPGAIGYDKPFDLVILQGNSAAAEPKVPGAGRSSPAPATLATHRANAFMPPVSSCALP